MLCHIVSSVDDFQLQVDDLGHIGNLFKVVDSAEVFYDRRMQSWVQTSR